VRGRRNKIRGGEYVVDIMVNVVCRFAYGLEGRELESLRAHQPKQEVSRQSVDLFLLEIAQG